MTKRIAFTALAAAVLVFGAAWRVSAADRDRGMVLYEARCVACHSTGVHTRENRRSRDFDDVREWVTRWSNFLGSDWGPTEIDDVSRYVNERYYGFPCPVDVCSLGS
jgi:cytochrome c5